MPCRVLQVVHLTPLALANSAAYRSWTASLPGQQMQPPAAAEGAAAGFAAATRMLAKLSLISGRVFPLPLSAEASAEAVPSRQQGDAASRQKCTAASTPAVPAKAHAAAGSPDAAAAPAATQGSGATQAAGGTGAAAQAAVAQSACAPANGNAQAAAAADQAASDAAGAAAPAEELDDIGERLSFVRKLLSFLILRAKSSQAVCCGTGFTWQSHMTSKKRRQRPAPDKRWLRTTCLSTC